MSNLLEKASIVTTPTAYDNGKILSVKPAPSLGSELITNGDFSNGSTGWTLSSAWSIGTSKAIFSDTIGGDIRTSSNVFTANKKYQIKLTVADLTSGTAFFGVGDGAASNLANYAHYANGEHTFNVTAPIGQELRVFSTTSSGSSYSISNISVKEEIDADFDFTRNSSATRVNSQGLIEDVQILSSNLVTNGDFSQEGSELVTNGDFATDSDWTTNDWNISGGSLNGSASTSIVFQNNLGTTIGKTYKVTLEVSNYVSGSIRFKVGGSSYENIASTNGIQEFYFVAATSANNILFSVQSAYTGSIDNVSVKEVGQDWTLGTGWSIGEDKGTVDNTVNANLDQFISGFSGKKVKVSFEISDLSSGGILVGDIVNPGAYNATSNGIHTFDYTATNSTFRVRAYGNPCSITNISVIEITDDTNLPRINYEGFSYQDALGSELVTNGDFSNGSAGWSVSNGTITDKYNASLTSYQNGIRITPFIKTGTFKVTFDLVVTSGSCKFVGGGSNEQTYSTSGAKEIIVINPSRFEFNAFNLGWVGTLDNVSVKEYLGQEVVPDSGRGSWLFEPQSTNLIPNANQYSGNTVYYTVTPNQSSPDGENNATLFVEKTSTSPYSVNSTNASIIGGQTYSYSFFVKYAGKQNIPVNATDGVSGFNANIDILNGTVNSGTAEIKDFGNGWFRVSMTRTVAASASNAAVNFNFGNQTGDGTSGFYLFGYQIEQQSFATSYIPTNGSTVTRLQDAAFGAGSSDLINSTEGVLYAEIAYLSDTGIYRTISINDGSNDNMVAFENRPTSNQIKAFVNVLGVNVMTSTQTLSNVKEFNKVAIKWKQNDFAWWVNGVKIYEDLSGSTFGSGVLNKVNFNNGVKNFPFQGKTKCLAVFKEALTDAELECLTTI